MSVIENFSKDVRMQDGFCTYCRTCRQKDRKQASWRYAAMNLRRKRQKQGLCQLCCQPAVSGIVMCIYHAIYRILYKQAKTRKQVNWMDMPIQDRKCMLEQLTQMAQDTSVCPYTQQPLIFGQNMHLDHKTPVSRDITQIYTLDNLQWVSAEYNRHKHDKTDAEFLEFCKLIVTNAGYTITG